MRASQPAAKRADDAVGAAVVAENGVAAAETVVVGAVSFPHSTVRIRSRSAITSSITRVRTKQAALV